MKGGNNMAEALLSESGQKGNGSKVSIAERIKRNRDALLGNA